MTDFLQKLPNLETAPEMLAILFNMLPVIYVLLVYSGGPDPSSKEERSVYPTCSSSYVTPVNKTCEEEGSGVMPIHCT